MPYISEFASSRSLTPSREPIATLLSDDGSRRPYGKLGTAQKNPDTKKAYPENIYFKLPVAFWTNGWAAHLPAPAVAMLLVLLDQARSKNEGWHLDRAQPPEGDVLLLRRHP